MSSNSVFILFRNNSFICRRAEEYASSAFVFEDITYMPNIPFYHHLWDDFDRYSKMFSNFFRYELAGSSVRSKWVKPHAYIALPDDALEIDKRIAIEFLLQCCCRNVDVMPECLLLSSQEDRYVAISRTCRMIVLSYVRGGKIENRLFLDNKDHPAEVLKSHIGSLIVNRGFSGLPIYLNGDNMRYLSGLGTYIEPEIILENYMGRVRD